MTVRLYPITRHIEKEGCCVHRDCWRTATEQRERYDGLVVIDYCAGHAQLARKVFGAEKRAAA